MELGAVHPARPDHAGHGDGVIADSKCTLGTIFAVVAVDVIDILTLTDVSEERVIPYDVQSIPADLRHLEGFVFQVRLQRADLAFDKAQACMLTVLIAFFKE